jgi:hypothetical protein
VAGIGEGTAAASQPAPAAAVEVRKGKPMRGLADRQRAFMSAPRQTAQAPGLSSPQTFSYQSGSSR